MVLLREVLFDRDLRMLWRFCSPSGHPTRRGARMEDSQEPVGPSGNPRCMTLRRRVALIVVIAVLAPIVLLAGLVLVVQSEWGERWAEKQVASHIHREVELNKIRLRLGWPPTVPLDHVGSGNPPWAKTPNLVDAHGLTARVEVLPLFERRLAVPLLEARRAEAGLELKGGQATWRFADDSRERGRIDLDRVFLGDGHVVYRDEDEDTALDVKVKGSLGATGELQLAGTGKLRGEHAKGTATLPALDPSLAFPVRFVGRGAVGTTKIAADGSVGAALQTFDLHLKLSGQTLKDLRKVFGLVLPETPPYRLAGRLRHQGKEWIYDPFEGKVGDSDLRGSVTYVKGGARPLFRADLQSKHLEFDDLGPLIGAPPKTGPGETASPKQRVQAAELAASSRVLPRGKFSTEQWDKMDADVKLVANRIERPNAVPVDSLSTHLVLKDAVLHVDPLTFGVANGRVTSTVVIDSHTKPPTGSIKADVQGLNFAPLFPAFKTMDEALGTMYGRAELNGRGASLPEMLTTSNCKVVLP